MSTIQERRAGILRAEAILKTIDQRRLSVGHLLAALAEMGPVRIMHTATADGRRVYELVAVEASDDDRFLQDPGMRLRLQTRQATQARRDRSQAIVAQARALRAGGMRWKAIGQQLDRDPEYLRKAVKAAISSASDEASG